MRFAALGAATAAALAAPLAVGHQSARIPPAPRHRIVVRVENGAGRLFDRMTGKPFQPRGANYVRLSATLLSTQGVDHSTFLVGAYDSRRAERALGQMQALGYNTVRVFVVGECRVGCMGDPATGRISTRYVANVVDFIRRAKRHRMLVILTSTFPPQRYMAMIGTNPLVADVNRIFLTSGGVTAFAAYWRDLVLELRRQHAPLDDVLAYDIQNEPALVTNNPPLTLSSGRLRAPNGRTYDLSDPAAKQRLVGDALVTFVDRVRAAIRRVDPTALVETSFFEPQGPNPSRIGDPRVVDTKAVIERSTLDFVDLHAYPGLALTFPQYMQNDGVSGPTRKPLIVGEMGAFKSAYDTPSQAAEALTAWQAASCPYGIQGWLVWTWDSDEQPELWSAQSEGAAIGNALAPAKRSDPCAPAGPRDLALGKPVTASSQAQYPAADAVDGNPATLWGAGAGPPQWIEIDLGASTTVARIRLIAAQDPAGTTDHRVYLRGPNPSDPYVLVAEPIGATHDRQEIDVGGGAPWTNVRFVRIETVSSPSWVSWREIEVLAP
jgi:hypothetical protein